jgi:hypothetical protein
MEFPAGTSVVDTISYLNKDDINGPGLSQFQKKTGDRSIDFAIYKISTYIQSSDLSERVKFTKELEELIQMLGPSNMSYLYSSLEKLVKLT